MLVVQKIRGLGRKAKVTMDDKIESYRELLSAPQNRLILGLIAVGLGAGLIASAYLRVCDYRGD